MRGSKGVAAAAAAAAWNAEQLQPLPPQDQLRGQLQGNVEPEQTVYLMGEGFGALLALAAAADVRCAALAARNLPVRAMLHLRSGTSHVPAHTQQQLRSIRPVGARQ